MDHHLAIVKALQEVEQYRKDVEAMNTAALDAQHAVYEAKTPRAEGQDPPEIRASARTIGSVGGVTIWIDVDNAREVEPIMKWLSKLGYKPGKRDDYALAKRMMWTYTREDGEELHRITLMAFLRGESCKFVKKGTVPQDVFELVCGDEPVGAIGAE